jgi:hypothetical protein
MLSSIVTAGDIKSRSLRMKIACILGSHLADMCRRDVQPVNLLFYEK